MARFLFRLFPHGPGRFGCLLGADCAALAGTFLLAALLRKYAGGTVAWLDYARLLPFLLLAPLFSFYRGLYSLTPLPRHEELRTLAIGTSLAYFLMTIAFFLFREGLDVSRLVFLGGWLGSFFTVPLVRAAMRRLFADAVWWGTPAVLFGDPERAAELTARLRAIPSMGLRPLALASDRPGPDAALERLGSEAAISAFADAHHHGEACALILLPAGHIADQQQILTATRYFHEVILIPEWYAADALPLGVRLVILGECVGLKISQNLFDPRRLVIKRVMDVAGSLLGGLLLLPLFGLLALLIVLESPGNPFYWQKRVGRGGKPLFVLKFRTMVPHADVYLQECLERSPELRAEWEATQKFRKDPRVTRFGQLLRVSSLDELPQLWNVLKGEMSLVGPRPIVDSEITKYGPAFELYTRVRPGITGLWQVSGRNDVSYARRVQLDQYYAYNWSIWLDLYILAKTPAAVLRRNGAY